MTVIKLGTRIYRVFNTEAAASFLFIIKNQEIKLKRIDAPKELSDNSIAHLEHDAEFALSAHIMDEQKFWEHQGDLLGSMI